MQLDWQTTANTSFPYLWCHGCEKRSNTSMLSIAGKGDTGVDHWMRLCPDCLDQIANFVRTEAVR